MREHIGRVASALVPIVCAAGSIDVMQAAGLFPPALAWDAWADWVILAALVFTFTSIGFAAAGRIRGAPPPVVDESQSVRQA